MTCSQSIIRHVKCGPSLYNATIQCEACKQRGHPASRCFALAAALYIREFIAKQTNDNNAQAAMEFWMSHNVPLLKDGDTNAALNENP
jgi:hypothetical protein